MLAKLKFRFNNNFNIRKNIIKELSTNKIENTNLKNNSFIDKNDMRILSYLSSYIWPSNHKDNAFNIKSRVLISLTLLFSSKVINIYVPFIFKDLIDQMHIVSTTTATKVVDNTDVLLNNIVIEGIGSSNSMELLTITPIFLILGYGISRSTAAGISYISRIYL